MQKLKHFICSKLKLQLPSVNSFGLVFVSQFFVATVHSIEFQKVSHETEFVQISFFKVLFLPNKIKFELHLHFSRVLNQNKINPY